MKLLKTKFFDSKSEEEQKTLRIELASAKMVLDLFKEILEQRLKEADARLDSTESQFRLGKALGNRSELRYLISLFKESDHD